MIIAERVDTSIFCEPLRRRAFSRRRREEEQKINPVFLILQNAFPTFSEKSELSVGKKKQKTSKIKPRITKK
jgi:hypothetical protein